MVMPLSRQMEDYLKRMDCLCIKIAYFELSKDYLLSSICSSSLELISEERTEADESYSTSSSGFFSSIFSS
jgi:sialic acid synthase SpsE